jgi:NTP pyrophosphatase (non-canonical NTP hydrolase)
MDFTKIQAEHKEWSAKNFPDQKAHHCLLGMIKEVGELAHAQLKLEQGIRVNEDHIAARRDAIADIALYLIGFCNYNKIDLGVLICTNQFVIDLSPVQVMQSLCHNLFDMQIGSSWFNKKVRCLEILSTLDLFCYNIGIDFEQNILDTWEQVKKRDWTKNKVNGAEGSVIV